MNTPTIKNIESISVIGVSQITNSLNIQPFLLWQPFKKALSSAAYPALVSFSIQNYSKKYFDHFNPTNDFEYCAAVEKRDLQTPDGMIEWNLPGGMYAVFEHVGLPDTFTQKLTEIFTVWLPQSDYRLDDRPHFQRMDECYRLNDPNSIEEIWIPISLK
jgi:AraC family transcriptional regulator